MIYVGIDIGDGESAVTVLTDDSVIEPVVQTLGYTKSMISVVGSLNGEVLIGEKALLEQNIQNLRARFKSRFLTSPVAADDVRRFAVGLRQLLLQFTGVLADPQHRIAVGCPAGWTQMDRERYADILRGVGFDNLYTVSESRAAFLYARHAHDIRVDAQLLEGNVLVIDIGSSTTDFAYITNGHERNIGTFGHVNLGGGLMEAYMLKEAVEKSPHAERLAAIFAEEPTWRYHCEIAARRLKEDYFLNEEAWVDTPCATQVVVYYDEPLPLTIFIDAASCARLLNTPMVELGGMSFQETLEASLKRAVVSTQDAPPQLVILTGGASRMNFFQGACREAFPQAVIAECPEPEFSIAKGLAYAARIDMRLKRFQADVQAYFDSGAIGRYVNESIESLADALAPPLADFIIEKAVIPAIEKWRKGKEGSLNDLEKELAVKAQMLMGSDEAVQALAPQIAGWSQALEKKIQRDLDEICVRYDIDRANMSLRRVRADAEVGSISIELPGKTLSVVVYLISALVVAAISGGGGAALVAGGPLGLIAGGVIGIIAAALVLFFGEQVYRNVNIPAWMRKTMPMTLYRRALHSESQRQKIVDALVKAMGDRNGPFAQRVAKDATADLQAQIQALAQQVEMPVY